MGSFFWLLTESSKLTNDYSFKDSIFVFLLISFFVDRCKSIQLFIASDFKDIHNLRLENIDAVPKKFLVPVLEAIAWAVSLLFLRTEIPNYIFWPFIIFSVVFILAALPYIFLISKIKDFIPPLDRSPIKRIGTKAYIWALRSILYMTTFTGLYLFVVFLLFVYPKFQFFTYIDWRIGGLIFGTLFVLNYLVQVTDTKTLDSLKEIQRKLLAGLIEVETAMSQMNVEVAGLTLKEHFQKNILGKLTTHLKNFEFILNEQKIICSPLKELISSKEPPPETLKLLETKITDYCLEKKKLLKAVENFKKEALKIQSMFQAYRKFHLLDQQTVEEINQAFQKEFNRIKGIEENFLTLIRTEILPTLQQYISQNKITVSEENKKLLP